MRRLERLGKALDNGQDCMPEGIKHAILSFHAPFLFTNIYRNTGVEPRPKPKQLPIVHLAARQIGHVPGTNGGQQHHFYPLK